jgi:hypothetical protein
VLPARRSHIAASLAQTLGLVTDECSCRKAPPHRTQSVRPSGRPLRWACPAGPVGMGGRQPGRSLRPNHGAVTHHVMRRTLRGGATITAPGVRPEKILLRRSRPGARRQSDEPSPLTTSPPTEPPASCASGPDAFARRASTHTPGSRRRRPWATTHLVPLETIHTTGTMREPAVTETTPRVENVVEHFHQRRSALVARHHQGITPVRRKAGFVRRDGPTTVRTDEVTKIMRPNSARSASATSSFRRRCPTHQKAQRADTTSTTTRSRSFSVARLDVFRTDSGIDNQTSSTEKSGQHFSNEDDSRHAVVRLSFQKSQYSSTVGTRPSDSYTDPQDAK